VTSERLVNQLSSFLSQLTLWLEIYSQDGLNS